jgi:serine/threonine-protein kinase
MTTPDDDLRPRIDALFDRALDLPTAARAALLARECADAPAVRRAVEELLQLVADEDPRFEPSLVVSGPLWQSLSRELAPAPAPEPARPGRRIGPWKLGHELGRGGMGTVYVAERVDGEFAQRAALKLLNAGVASEQALARFAQERRILAGLEHAGIARLLDGGRTAEGQPYFAMELVEGLPIDLYCDTERLSVRARLELALAVGRAVEHAHRNLVVHRDLKPSNIVVDAEGQVKLLDFGIAKLLQPELEDSGLTQTAARVLTPSFASPEQVRGQRITVASDVYQLGLLLYRLLTGQPAYRLSGSSALAIERTVCTVEPPRPSAQVLVVPTAADEEPPDLARLASLRGTTPAGLAALLRGDLDSIVLKALRKEPERRYETVGQLTADIERHLAGLPVQARPDTLSYRASRFVARHRAAVGGLALAFALLVAWALTATYQTTLIRQERDRAQAEGAKAAQVKDFLVQIFASADPDEARGEELTARELLDRGWRRIESELAGQPEIQLELIETVAEAYRELGLFDRARTLLDQGREIGGRIGAPLDGVLRIYGEVEREAGAYATARALLEEALAVARERHGAESPQVAAVLSNLGRTLHAQGDYPAARRLFEQALAMRQATLGARHEDTAESQDDLALALQNLGEYAAAEALLADALAVRREILPADHPDIASNLSDLALVVQALGDAPRAAAIYRDALAAMIRVRGAEHPYVAIVMNNLARLLWTTGELEEAEDLLRQALAIRRAALGDDHLYVALNLNDLGLTLQRQGRLDEAEAVLRQSLTVYPPDHPWRAASIFNLGRVLEDRGDYGAAEAAYREALARQREQYGADHERVGIDLQQIGIVRHRQGDLAGAEEDLSAALEIFRQKLPEGHTRIAEALVPLAEVLIAAGRPGEAEPLLREALAIRQAGFGAEDERTQKTARLLATLVSG